MSVSLTRSPRYFLLSCLTFATVFLQVALQAPSPALAKPPPPAPSGHYDEIHDEYGRVRPHYREIMNVYKKFSDRRKRKVYRNSLKEFRGDNALNPLPRILLDSEYDNGLKPGVEQRGRALRAFLQDHYSGRREYIKAGVIPEEVIERIIARSLESQYAGQVDPAIVAFPYGPDVIRDKAGVFRVVEDNSGFIGGIGDLEKALEILYNQVPEYNGILKHRDPFEYYKTVVDRYRARANGGRVAIFMVPPYADNEDSRIQQIMKRLDVDVITPYTNKKMVVESDGLYVEWKEGGRKVKEKIGFLALNGEHWWLDARHPVTAPIALTEYARLVLSEIKSGDLKGVRKDLKRQFVEVMDKLDPKTGFPDQARIEILLRQMGEWEEFAEIRGLSKPGLIDAILKKQVAVNFTPGTNFTNDKEFYLYVEDLVRFYLKEEPILRNIETHRVGVVDSSGRVTANEALIANAAKNQDQYVIKIVDGRGGDGITVGPKVSREVYLKALERARGEAGRTIIQRYTPLSLVGQDIVDVRVISDVGPKGKVFVSNTPWGRALPVNGDGKVNLSAQGRETTVVVAPAAPYCKDIFTVHR